MPYLTPDTPADNYVCRGFRIPQELSQYFTGAIRELLNLWNWEEFGTLTPEETVALFQIVIDNEEPCMLAMVGMIMASPIAVLNDKFLPCEGQTLDKDDYPELWEIWDPTRRSETQLQLPDLTDRMIVHDGIYNAFWQQGGANLTTLNLLQMPQHTHTIQYGYGPGLTPGFAPAGPPASYPIATPETTSPAGGTNYFDNRSEYMALKWVICVTP